MSDAVAAGRQRRSRRGERSRRDRSRAEATIRRLERRIPYYDLLDEDALDRIEQHADRILAEIGIEVWGDDEAIRLFGEQGLNVGDNQPYSGKQLNATMDRHAEAQGIPYCTVEIRQDQIGTAAGQARWATLLADVMGRVALEV